MKKYILSAAIVALTSVAFVNANELNSNKINTAIVTVQDSTTSTPVKLEELPEPVKTTLLSDAYKAWTPTEAFWVKEEGGKEYYQINVTKEEEKASLKIKADGTPSE
ncbi:hypothetical protein [Pedobacter alpinus]|uniref:Uncharacterized protein n=1 Tax=Pedobacter alpinus TaxID=1590643 RepID=A0ABW5TR61_9SPHI